jgi:nitrite reductase/ring-hydroxylating ferredoxin subunit
MTLDWVENQFFTEDGRFLICATHGALYEPDTGLCVDGPPCGQMLLRVPLRCEAGRVLATCPADPG